MIVLDGSMGEGGGQILRTALSLSLVTGQPFHMNQIRAGREKPGLLRQHLTAVLAAAEISSAVAEGAALGASSISFSPGSVRPGNYRFAVGSAGSATLVFQTVLPALMLASEPSHVTVEGGTHNHAAPPFDFLARAFAPILERMGPRIQLQLERYGFYPAGGGCFHAQIEPAPALTPLSIGPRSEVTHQRILAIVANLPRHIARREAEAVSSLLGWSEETREIRTTGDSPGPGNVALVEVGSGQVTEVFSAFGQLGVSAEMVGADVAGQARDYLASGAAIGEHLTDQLLIPFALAGSGSFTAHRLNRHALTNVDVIAKFLPVRFHFAEEDSFTRVTVSRSHPQ